MLHVLVNSCQLESTMLPRCTPRQAFLFRAESDVLTAKFAVSMRESSELAQLYADTEARLNALKEKVNCKEGSVEKMQKEIDALGGGSALERGKGRHALWTCRCHDKI